MELQAYELFVPFMVEDIIQDKETHNIYKILDILHTYSAAQKTIVNVEFKVRDINTNIETTIPYKSDIWEIVKDE